MKPSLIIAIKEIKLLFKSTRRIFLLFMMPMIILIIGVLVGFIALYAVPSTTEQSVEILIIQDDEGINNTLNWGNIYYTLLQTQNTTKDYTYTNKTMNDYDLLLTDTEFRVLIYIPENFSLIIDETGIAKIYIYYDNNELINEEIISQIGHVTSVFNQQLIFIEYGGPLNLLRVVIIPEGTSQGSGAILASALSIIPLYLVIFLVIPPITLVLISVTIEREQKTLEAILLQPIDRKQFILGKILYGALIVSINTILTFGAIILLILVLFFMNSNASNKIIPLIDDFIKNLLGSEFQFYMLIAYIFIGLIIISLLLVAAAVFFSMIAKDEREANMVISTIIILPMISILFLIYLPMGGLPDSILTIIGMIPVIGYLFSIYLILLKGEIILIAWISLIFQTIWIFFIIWLAGRLIESEGILNISFKKILKFWAKK